jgi:hypothetical protein
MLVQNHQHLFLIGGSIFCQLLSRMASKLTFYTNMYYFFLTKITRQIAYQTMWSS